jgi:hypothetical protein
MRSRACVLACLFVAALTTAFPGAAQGPLIEVEAAGLAKIGGWLIRTLGAYAVDKGMDVLVDKALGRDNEAKLQEIERRLKRQVDAKNAENRKQIEAELGVARQELVILRFLMERRPTKQQIEKYQAELDSDLKLIHMTLAEHERKLADHDQKLAEQGKLIEDQGREIDDLKHQIHQPQPSSPPAPLPQLPPSQPGGGATFPGNPIHPGATLTIEVRGKDNLIRLREATHPVAMGIFRFSRNGGQAAYFLPPGTRAIVELFGPNNRISMSARLAQQVQILNHGFYYQPLVY